MLDIKLAKSVTLTEIIAAHRKQPEGYSPDRKDYRMYEVTTNEGIFRILAKDELDAYKIFLEEYDDGALELPTD